MFLRFSQTSRNTYSVLGKTVYGSFNVDNRNIMLARFIHVGVYVQCETYCFLKENLPNLTLQNAILNLYVIYFNQDIAA